MSENKKTTRKSQASNPKTTSGNRKTKTHSVGENLSAQENIKKTYELRPKPPKKK